MNREEALILEYNTIKQEIFIMMGRVDQLLIMEYTIGIAFIGIGYELESPLLMILTIIFIISLQEMINTRRRHMVRASIYIEKYIETEVKMLKWETIVGKVDAKYRKKYLQKNIFISMYQFISNNSAIVIALISCVMYFNLIYKEHQCITNWNILVVLILFFILIIQCLTYSNYRKMANKYYKIMKEVLEEDLNL